MCSLIELFHFVFIVKKGLYAFDLGFKDFFLSLRRAVFRIQQKHRSVILTENFLQIFHCTLILQVIFNVPDVSPFAFQPSWEIADPIISLVGACVVLLSTCPVLRQSINILLEGMGFRISMNNSEILDIFRRPVAFDPFVYGSSN